jgi:hypothetical protein
MTLQSEQRNGVVWGYVFEFKFCAARWDYFGDTGFAFLEERGRTPEALFFRLTQLPLSSTPRIATIDPSMTTLQFGNWRATQILLAVVERYIVR